MKEKNIFKTYNIVFQLYIFDVTALNGKCNIFVARKSG